MNDKIVDLDIEDVIYIDKENEGGRSALIVCFPTGVFYHCQVGGMLCEQVKCEGYVINMHTLGIDFDDCDYLCSFRNREKIHHEGQFKVGEIIDAYLKKHTEKWKISLATDFERIYELQEGWWPVIGKHRKTDIKGYIHIGNCD